MRWELPLQDFGRNAILVAKQILVQKVREAERAQIFEEYKDRVNEIIVGTVQQADRGNVLRPARPAFFMGRSGVRRPQKSSGSARIRSQLTTGPSRQT